MDAPKVRWYFSTMAARRDDSLRRIRFHRHKYGTELLVDAGFLRQLPNFDFSTRPCALDFHDVLLVTAGVGRVSVDDRAYRLAPGVVLLTAPGEVRQLHVKDLDGACLFFAPEFVTMTFADPRFLERFACLRRHRSSAVLTLTRSQQRRYLATFRAMQREIRGLVDDASDALRALLYDLLVNLDRWYVARYGPPAPEVSDVVRRFQEMVEQDHADDHRVLAYARRLGLTPGHLSALCRAELGHGAAAVVRRRLVLEARRLLRSSELPVAEIGERLGFGDPAYFSRFLRRETGHSPSGLRARRARIGAP